VLHRCETNPAPPSAAQRAATGADSQPPVAPRNVEEFQRRAITPRARMFMAHSLH
jgi:hypothetical protein